MDMDMEQLKSEEQMEMMMTMQMDKLPGLCGVYNDVVPELPPSDFCGATSSRVPNYIHVASPSFMPTTSSQPFLSNSTQKRNSMAAMREMIFRIAAMQPIHIDPESVKPPKRRNVKISKDPQSVAARHRRERISERIRILQRLVPGGTKMDTASMLDEAIHYVKFLKTQVQSLERAAANSNTPTPGIGFPVAMSTGAYLPSSSSSYSYSSMPKPYQPHFGDA